MSEEKARSAKAPKAVIEQGDDAKVDADPSFAADSGEQGGSRRAASDAAEDPARVGGRFQDATMGFIEGVGRRAWAYADAHPHTVLYGAVGLLLAVLILVLGLGTPSSSPSSWASERRSVRCATARAAFTISLAESSVASGRRERSRAARLKGAFT